MQSKHISIIMLWISAGLVTPTWSVAQGIAVFSGTPSVRVNETGTDRAAERLATEQAKNLGVVITKVGDKYFWATRSNKELIPHVGGVFVTFVAVDGAGYVRFIKRDGKAEAALLSPAERDFDYVEHLIIGLRSVTYYGKAL
jgi:hypothetical protein